MMINPGSMVDKLIEFRRPLVVLGHVALIALSYLLAFVLRFEGEIPPELWGFFLRSLPSLILCRIVVFSWFHLHQGLWRYVSTRDLVEIFKAVTLSSLIFVAGLYAAVGTSFPRSIVLLDWLLCFGLVAGVRIVIRMLRESSPSLRQQRGRRALIVGAGDAGEHLIREIHHNPTLDYEVVGLIDDDPRKKRQRIHGVQVLGTIDELPQLCSTQNVQEVLLALPSATTEERGRILFACRTAGVVVKTVPSIKDLFSGRADIGQLQQVVPEDLLGRRAVHVDMDRLVAEIQGRRVMVTGAAGSIGSELCRQLAALKPERLIMYDRAESGLYFAGVELKDTHDELEIVSVVGDINDRPKLNEVMSRHAPEVLYHAAAYKHVPLMEQHPLEAIENNVFGTETVALAAEDHRVRKFVFVSTDKAVRPISTMGMTKRVAEDLLRVRSGGPTIYVAVRFGNVLGSAGSVMPLFQWQMAKGGPVTVTDPEATRYFMLIMEAAQLVLEAGAMGRGGEVFFLDMGSPVRIMELAQDLMRLSGIDPSADMALQTVGLRPGERLREELVRETEQFLASKHEQIFVVVDRPIDSAAFSNDFTSLRRLVRERDRHGAMTLLASMAGTPGGLETATQADAPRG
jgi:FlaA1/EpsC-like NDP-sugar epimerase